VAGLIGELGKEAGRSIFGEVVVWLFRAVVAAAITAFGYGSLVIADVAPPPDEIIDRIGPGSSKPVYRAAGVREVKAIASDGRAGELARSIELKVTRGILPVSDQFGGVRIQYALSKIDSGRGALNRATMAWALSPSGGDWIYCPRTVVEFSNSQSLADKVAAHINNGISASNSSGVLQCS
jgi:hypothetical protein